MPGGRLASRSHRARWSSPHSSRRITGDHNFDVALLSFSWDASFIQDAMFGCDQYEGGFNMVKYCNEQVDALNARRSGHSMRPPVASC